MIFRGMTIDFFFFASLFYTYVVLDNTVSDYTFFYAKSKERIIEYRKSFWAHMYRTKQNYRTIRLIPTQIGLKLCLYISVWLSLSLYLSV